MGQGACHGKGDKGQGGKGMWERSRDICPEGTKVCLWREQRTDCGTQTNGGHKDKGVTCVTIRCLLLVGHVNQGSQRGLLIGGLWQSTFRGRRSQIMEQSLVIRFRDVISMVFSKAEGLRKKGKACQRHMFKCLAPFPFSSKVKSGQFSSLQMLSIYKFFIFFFSFETRSCYVALAVPKLAIKTMLAQNLT